MPQDTTTGQRLRVLMERSGLPYRRLAEAIGYKSPAGLQRFTDPDYDRLLPMDKAKQIAAAFEGKGNPPIAANEVMALAGVDDALISNVRPAPFEGASLERLRNDLPVYGTALGAEMIVEGEAVEQTRLNTGEVVEYRKRPSILTGVERVYGIYVQGASMYPAHRDGAFLFVQKGAPLHIDDDVVVYLRPKGEDDDGERATMVLIKRLVRRSAQYVELEQFSPAKRFKIAAADVLRIDRVLTTDDYA